MRLKLAACILIASCLPAAAAEQSLHLPPQGLSVTVTGVAHVERAAQGTFIHVDRPGAQTTTVSGFIAFGNEPTFPGLEAIDGREVSITGVLVRGGRTMIDMNNPAQLGVG